jgi:polar amino acid transport system substrate-binding protein
VTVELGHALARSLGTVASFIVYSNSGEVTADLNAGKLDVSFMPVDDERRVSLTVGPAYFLIENTYLVRPGSTIANIADVDRPDVRVIGIVNTTTIRNTARLLKQTTIAPVASVGDAIERLRTGQADAFALTHDSLPPLAAQLPGSRILAGSYQSTDSAVVLPKQQSAAMPRVAQFMEDFKNSGQLARLLQNHGLA